MFTEAMELRPSFENLQSAEQAQNSLEIAAGLTVTFVGSRILAENISQGKILQAATGALMLWGGLTLIKEGLSV